MRIDLAKIDAEILEGDFRIESERVEAAGEPFELQDCSVHYSVYRINGSDIYLKARYDGKLQMDCTSCLERFPMPLRDDFGVLLTTRAPEDVSEADTDELDGEVELIREDFIDIKRHVIDTVQLNIPMAGRCSDGCKGICPTCGVDLNRTTCTCSREHSDPRWNALKSLLDKKE